MDHCRQSPGWNSSAFGCLVEAVVLSACSQPRRVAGLSCCDVDRQVVVGLDVILHACEIERAELTLNRALGSTITTNASKRNGLACTNSRAM